MLQNFNMTVRKYHKLNFKTYKPKRKVRVRKEEAVPLVIDVGKSFSSLGGVCGFFISSFLMSLKSYFKTKRRVRSYIMKYEKTIDLRDSDQ